MPALSMRTARARGGRRSCWARAGPPAKVGAVVGPDLSRRGRGVRLQGGAADPAPDLDGLAAGDDDLAVAGEGGEGEEDSSGVVVDGEGRLGAGELVQDGLP